MPQIDLPRTRRPSSRAHRDGASPLRWCLAVAAAASTSACGGAATAPGGAVSAVVVSPSSDTVVVGAVAALQVTVIGTNGQPLTGESVFWNSGNPAIATVSAQGAVTGIGEGRVQIAASARGKSGIATVVVLRAPVAAVTVAPSLDTLRTGASVRLSVTLRDVRGAVLTGRTITWSTSAPGVAAADGTGLVTAVAPGSATILATSEGVSGSATIVVVPPPAASVRVAPTKGTIPPGGTIQLTATALDAAGHVIAGAPIVWSSSSDAVATVSGTGLATGLLPGVAQITARSGTAKGTAKVTVSTKTRS